MERIQFEPVGLLLPEGTDKLIGRQARQCFEPFAEIVGIQEAAQTVAELFMAVVVIGFQGGFLDRPVHPLHLTVGPRMIGLGQPVLDAIAKTNAVKRMPSVNGCRALPAFGQIRELNPIVS